MMMDTIEYIDAYFTGSLSDAEKGLFESRCEEDEAFAKEVAFYISARHVINRDLLEQKKQTWKAAAEEELPEIPSLKRSFAGRWVAYVAAACLVLAASVYLFEANSSPRKLAENYLTDDYTNLSQQMGAGKDSITLGKAAYNNKQYDYALQLFEGIEQRDSTNSEVKKLAGLSFLQTNDYTNALKEFDKLAALKGLHNNSGDFLKALTFMKRNSPGDKKQAKLLLQKVVSDKEDGFEKAQEWLSKF